MSWVSVHPLVCVTVAGLLLLPSTCYHLLSVTTADLCLAAACTSAQQGVDAQHGSLVVLFGCRMAVR